MKLVPKQNCPRCGREVGTPISEPGRYSLCLGEGCYAVRIFGADMMLRLATDAEIRQATAAVQAAQRMERGIN